MPDIPLNLPPASSEFTPELKAELLALIDALLDDSINPTQVQRLEEIVIAHRDAAVLYYELVHLWCILPFHLSRGMINLMEPEGGPGFAGAGMHESMVLPAIHEGDLAEFDDPLTHAADAPTTIRRVAPSEPTHHRWWMAGTAAAAAVTMLGVALAWHAWHPPAQIAVAPPVRLPPAIVPPAPAPVPEAPPVVVVPPAVLTATAGAVFEDASTIKPGTPLAVGDSVRLTRGAVELTFANAAVVVVRGPAHVRLVDRNSLALDTGSVAAHVPPSAHGFRIDSPGSSVVDLGTDFGVRSIAGSARSEVDVFNGSVTAAPLDNAGRQLAAPVRIETGHAVQLRVADPVPVNVVYAPAQFDRDINAIRMPVAFHGSGIGGALGAADPNWQIVSVPNDPNWKPRPAVVISNLWPKYAPNTADGRWISLSDPQREVANGEYVLRTTADLVGINLKTLAVQVRFAVDNHITDVRVNGVSTGASTLNLKQADDFGGYVVTLPSASWHAGPNQIDLVLLNNAFDGSDTPSFMALQATWTATASPVVLR